MQYSKQSIQTLKEHIKQLSASQKAIKPQRKEVHFDGKRTMPAWKAVQQHLINRYDLRHLYIAYGIMRGRTIDQIEPKRKTKFDQSKVNQIIESYGQAVRTDQE